MVFRAAGGPRGVAAKGSAIMFLPRRRRSKGTIGIDDRHTKKINQT